MSNQAPCSASLPDATRSAIHGKVIRLARDILITSCSQHRWRSSGRTEAHRPDPRRLPRSTSTAQRIRGRDRCALEQRPHSAAQAVAHHHQMRDLQHAHAKFQRGAGAVIGGVRARRAAPGWPRCARSASSPGAASKIIAGSTRLSTHATTIAFGACPCVAPAIRITGAAPATLLPETVGIPQEGLHMSLYEPFSQGKSPTDWHSPTPLW